MRVLPRGLLTGGDALGRKRHVAFQPELTGRTFPHHSGDNGGHQKDLLLRKGWRPYPDVFPVVWHSS